MALELTPAAERAAQEIRIRPQIVLKIDGVDDLFGAVPIEKYIRVGDPDLFIGDDWVIGGLTEHENSKDLIDAKGTGTKISQQLMPDLGAVTSASSIAVSLLDRAGVVSRMISPGVVVDDILGRRAKLYMGFQGTAWPEDFVEIFAGMIDDIQSGAGNVSLNIVHPEKKKQQKLFFKTEGLLGARTANFTVTIANPAVLTSVAHGLVEGQPIAISTAGTLPTNLSAGVYYVRNPAADTFNVSTSATDTTKVITTGVQAGVHSFTTGINAGETTVKCAGASTTFQFRPLGPDGGFDAAIRHYVRIDDEVIEFAGLTSTNIVGLTRGALGTTPAYHAPDSKIESFYVLEDDCMRLALKFMLSGWNGNFIDEQALLEIGNTSLDDPAATTSTLITLPATVDAVADYGLMVGDYIYLNNPTEAGDGGAWFPISGFQDFEGETNRILEIETWAFAKQPDCTGTTIGFRSRYDTLGQGLQMSPLDVDIEEHERWRDLILLAYQYRFYAKDTLDGKEFLEKEIYMPYGAYSIPRKGRCSVGFHIGPLASEQIKILDRHSIKNPSKSLKLRRSSSRNFYNAVAYKFDESPLDDKFLSGFLQLDTDSRARIPNVGNKVFSVESKGMRTDLLALSRAAQSATRRLNRYKYGAEYFENVDVFFRVAFNVEPGDLVVIDFEDLQVTNTIDGGRDKPAKFFEVINKSLDLTTGDVSLSVIDTNYDASERYGLISPSSEVVAGSTVYAEIHESFGGKYGSSEWKKWEPFIGLPVLVHSEDFSFAEEVTLIGLDPANKNKLLFDPSTPLSIPAAAGHVIDIAMYSIDTHQRTNRLYKLFFSHFSPQVDVVTGTDNLTFDVSAPDALLFLPGATVLVHSEDFVTASGEVKVESVVGTTVTVKTSLGFTPSAGQKVSFIGFPDGDSAYRWI